MTNVLEELKRLYEAGTKGEWAHVRRNQKPVGHIRVPDGPFVFERGFGPRIAADADLIVAMHAHLPALLRIAEAAKALQRRAMISGPFHDDTALEEAFASLDEALASLAQTHPPKVKP